jgi:hypothetical protein
MKPQDSWKSINLVPVLTVTFLSEFSLFQLSISCLYTIRHLPTVFICYLYLLLIEVTFLNILTIKFNNFIS